MNNIKAFFKVKSFSIYNIDTNQNVNIDPLLKKFICSEKYFLNTDKDLHYDPKMFHEFLKFFSIENKEHKYHVYYVYEYFNHDHVNSYQNKMILCNGIIDDKKLG